MMAPVIITIAAVLSSWLLGRAIWHATRGNILLKDPLLGVKWQGYGSLGPNLIIYFGGIGEHPGYPIFPATIRWLKKLFSADYSVLGITAPGFGKTSHPDEFGLRDGNVPYEIFAESLVRTLKLAGVESVRCVGTSLGANLAGTFAVVATEENIRVEKVALIEGLLKPMSRKKLEKRFAGDPAKSAWNRLVFKWFSSRKLFVRLTNRGVCRMILREIIPIGRRMNVVRFHQEQLANTILEDELKSLSKAYVPVVAFVVEDSPLSSPVAWEKAHFNSLAAVYYFPGETHLSLTNDPVIFGQAIVRD